MLAGQDSRRPDFRLYLSMLYCLFCLLPHCIVNSCYPIWGWRLQGLTLLASSIPLYERNIP